VIRLRTVLECGRCASFQGHFLCRPVPNPKRPIRNEII
jgi:hypothetical protein